MAQVKIYHDEDNRYYTVNFDLKQAILSRLPGDVIGDAQFDFYLDVSTNMRKSNGTAFSHYLVRTLDDVPPTYSTATDFGELCRFYIEYFMQTAELAMSSSSTSSSSESSFSSSSTSSSEGRSSSSSSNSSSSSSSSSTSSESAGNVSTSSSSSSSSGV